MSLPMKLEIFSASLGVPWAKSLERTNDSLGFSFQVGQPLGYYSSWAFFVISVSSFCCMGSSRTRVSWSIFWSVCGDDIIITDDRVSSRYQQILDSLGVIVSKDKTLVSYSGCGEFAKKFRTHGLTKDFSPVSFRNVMNSHHLLRIPYHLSCGLAVDSL